VSQTHVSHEGLAKPGSRGNRRATVRYRCAPATVGKVFSADDHEFQRAWILDLSLTGIGMQLPRSLDLGQLVIVSVRDNENKKTHELPARVMRCERLLQGDWLVGCELTTPLSPEELEYFL
jgi:hypothetical protein